MLDLRKSDLPPSSPTRRADRDPFVDPHQSRGAPPPFTENQSVLIYDDKTTLDGHTESNATAASALHTPSDAQSSTIAPPQPPPMVPIVDNEAVAMDRAAQSLEEAAAQQTNQKMQKMLLRKAKKMRKKAAKRRGEHNIGVAKGVGGGLVMLVTTPLFVTGAVIEGTGTMLKATGMLLKGTGAGLKKAHTCAMDKLDL